MVADSPYSAVGNGGVGTTNVPDTVYEPAMVCVAVAAVSTLVFVALATYVVDAISAMAPIGINIEQSIIIRLIYSPKNKKPLKISSGQEVDDNLWNCAAYSIYSQALLTPNGPGDIYHQNNKKDAHRAISIYSDAKAEVITPHHSNITMTPVILTDY